MKPVIVIIGTRPEGIKMIPVYCALKKIGIPVILCSTMQHDGLLRDVFTIFQIKPDIELGIMRPGQDLFHITQALLEKIKQVFVQISPSLVLVQGDTTSAMVASLAAFYLHIKVGHVEAGLRTSDLSQPFPEEMNRRFISMLAQLHFTPTALAVGNLLAERVNRETIFCTGNPVVDALRIIQIKITDRVIAIDEAICKLVSSIQNNNQRLVLLTTHRRESFDGGIENILQAAKLFAQQHPDVIIFYPFHPNPNVVKALKAVDLTQCTNIITCEPVAYKELVYLLLHADLVVTDSGGICEEAVSLGKFGLILRETTERPEAVWAGCAHLVGTHTKSIIHHMHKQLFETKHSDNSTNKDTRSLFGDGYAADNIARIIKQVLQIDSVVKQSEKKQWKGNEAV